MKGATTSAAITVQTSRFPPPNLEVFLDPFLSILPPAEILPSGKWLFLVNFPIKNRDVP